MYVHTLGFNYSVKYRASDLYHQDLVVIPRGYKLMGFGFGNDYPLATHFIHPDSFRCFPISKLTLSHPVFLLQNYSNLIDLESLSCSVCATTIYPYVPKYPVGYEVLGFGITKKYTEATHFISASVGEPNTLYKATLLGGDTPRIMLRKIEE